MAQFVYQIEAECKHLLDPRSCSICMDRSRKIAGAFLQDMIRVAINPVVLEVPEN